MRHNIGTKISKKVEAQKVIKMQFRDFTQSWGRQAGGGAIAPKLPRSYATDAKCKCQQDKR